MNPCEEKGAGGRYTSPRMPYISAIQHWSLRLVQDFRYCIQRLYQEISRVLSSRIESGVAPVQLRKALKNELGSLYPSKKDVSDIVLFSFVRYLIASSLRVSERSD